MASPTPGTDYSSPHVKHATEVLWQDALRHLSSTNNEVLLPVDITKFIGPQNLEVIKSRLADLLGCHCVAFVDDSMGCIRLTKRPEYSGASDAAQHVITPIINAAGIIDVHDADKKSSPAKKGEKKEKIPRPPNAFILYRQYYHPIVRDANPNFHNNDISVAIGNQWNNETEEVRAHFRKLAEEMKRQHFEKYPGYQYAPRKPSEKKRRHSRRATETIETIEDSEAVSPQSSGEASMQDVVFTVRDEAGSADDALAFIQLDEPLRDIDITDLSIENYEQWMATAGAAQNLASFDGALPQVNSAIAQQEFSGLA